MPNLESQAHFHSPPFESSQGKIFMSSQAKQRSETTLFAILLGLSAIGFVWGVLVATEAVGQEFVFSSESTPIAEPLEEPVPVELEITEPVDVSEPEDPSGGVTLTWKPVELDTPTDSNRSTESEGTIEAIPSPPRITEEPRVLPTQPEGATEEPAIVAMIDPQEPVPLNEQETESVLDVEEPTPMEVAEPMEIAEPVELEETLPTPPAPEVEETNPVPSEGPAELRPVPDSAHETEDDSQEVYPASLDGIVPGRTTRAQVEEKLGAAVRSFHVLESPSYQYAIPDFEHIEVIYDNEQIVASILIELPMPIEVSMLLQAMPQLGNIKPAVIYDEAGYVLGLALPERGVLCSLEPATAPGRSTMKATQLIFEPVSSETFVLRAEQRFLDSWTQAMRDVNIALRLSGTNGRAHWMSARLRLMRGDYEGALPHALRAVEIEPSSIEFTLTRADALRQVRREVEAIEQAESILPLTNSQPLLKAKTQCLLGELYSLGAADHARAYDYHNAAIATAKPLIDSTDPEIQMEAVDVLIDAHLGVAKALAWGEWSDKENAIPHWLEQARSLSERLVDVPSRGAEARFRVATRAVASYVGLQGALDPEPWLEDAKESGELMVEQASDVGQQAQCLWNLGLVYFDAAQIYQIRGEYDLALRYGEFATLVFERSMPHRTTDTDAYVLARLCYRLGMIHAMALSNHETAVQWFDKSLPLFNDSAQHVAVRELGRFGETFVSMGVSYWQVDRKDDAVLLTRQGINLINLGIERDVAEGTILERPYNNMGLMLRDLGRESEANDFFDLALRAKQDELR
jgi:tetratricopeptide (TPR) repeat protein